MNNLKVYILRKDVIQECAVKEPVTIEFHRKGAPSRLVFDVLKDDILSFEEGNVVRLDYENKTIFVGFVFSKKRTNNILINVVAYDQLRYFKNKDTYAYANKTASQVLQMLIKDFNLVAGVIEDSKYIIATKLEVDEDLIEIVQNALDETLLATRTMYVLYDDAGKITLRNINSLRTNILLDETTSEQFSYVTSIDENTSNKIKLFYDNTQTGTREVYIAQNSNDIANWGILQRTERLESNINAKQKADSYLALYNRKTRKLEKKGVFGNVACRAGASVAVKMSLGDIELAQFMVIDYAKHTFYESDYRMDLKLIGGDFVA